MKKNTQNQSGQILLIIVLLSAVLLTVGLSVSHIGGNDTKITKLEEDNKKALAAAEAGVDLALQSTNTQGTIPIAGITGSYQVDTTSTDSFASPIVKKDTQYTFYLSDYPTFANPYNAGLTFYYQTSNPDPAIEITIIKQDNTVRHFVIDKQNRITSASLPFQGSFPIDGTTFNYSFALAAADVSNSKVMFVRALFADTKVGFHALAGNLPLQGKKITSTATTTTNVQKTVELFQSYPQIPSDFFVTSF